LPPNDFSFAFFLFRRGGKKVEEVDRIIKRVGKEEEWGGIK
jgi:hypothetical protein